MKRAISLCLLVSVFATVVALGEPVKVFHDLLWNQDALKYPLSGPGYPVLAVTEVYDADTYEALLHIAPQLIAHVGIRLANAYAHEKDTPGGRELREEIVALIKGADRIVVYFQNYGKYGRWVCSVFVYNGAVCTDLSQLVRERTRPPIPEGE